MPGSLARARKFTRSGPHIGLKRPCRLSVAPDRPILPPPDRGPGDGTSQNHGSAVENAKKQDERPKISGVTDELSECDKPQDESDNDSELDYNGHRQGAAGSRGTHPSCSHEE